LNRILGGPLTDAERALLVTEARRLLGIPWKHKGRTERGLDCLGLIWLALSRTLLVVRDQALPLPRNDYGKTPFNGHLRAGLVEWLGPPVAGQPEAGDIITVRWVGDAHHVAIVGPHPHRRVGLIHADNTATGGPRVVEQGWDYLWDRRFIEAFRP
jgi:cell wall-associated NlpC family hydrolase